MKTKSVANRSEKWQFSRLVRANKPFAGKFAEDWKKSLKIVSLEKNLALQAQLTY